MKLVLDASAAYTFTGDPELDNRIYRTDELLAPELLVAELLNARWKNMRRGNLAPTVSTVLSILETVTLLPIRPYARQAAAIAEQLDHPIYDSIYIAIAQLEEARLITADTRLQRKLAEHQLDHLLA